MESTWEMIRRYGGDAEGVERRFAGDDALFALCLEEFREDENFNDIAKAVAEGDTRRAFECAHSLKGVSANLGLTPFYDKVSVLTESLRRGACDNVSQELADVFEARKAIPHPQSGQSAR